jgi:tetratricopeptide (TPR) repeat protein
MALARVLLQSTQAEAPAAPPPAPRPKETRSGRVTQAPRPLGVLAVLVSLGLQPAPELPPLVPRAQREAEKLADEVLAAPAGAVPFDVRAQALAIKGLYTRALTAYVEGLRPYLPPRYSEGLLRMVRTHPGLSRPDSMLVPDPLLAVRHYAAGLNFYFARNYRSAEKEFLAAIENDSQDARFFYYLGLSRLLQNKRGAAEDVDQGARLEARGRPAPAAVSAALERVQGPARRHVNEARTRPPEDGR